MREKEDDANAVKYFLVCQYETDEKICNFSRDKQLIL